MNDILEFRGSAALITGGSRGLGLALGRELAARGSAVVLVAREEDALAAAVAHVRARGGEAFGIAADVGDPEATYAIAGQSAALVGRPIDLLINNASALGPVPLRLLLDTDCEDLSRAIQVNVLGAFRLTKALLGPMVLRGRGTVLNISSDAAVEAYPRWGAYGASKAALDQLTKVWAAELGGTGVRMLAVDPGEMNTRMHAQAVPEADPHTLADPATVASRILALLGPGRPPGGGARVAIGSAPQDGGPT